MISSPCFLEEMVGNWHSFFLKYLMEWSSEPIWAQGLLSFLET